ncbi:MAG: VanZ family protein [Rhodopila sp.]|nr:VanZ family protein [Rhodopila sp.]
MRHDILSWPGRRRLGCLCLIYAALTLYSSTIIGPLGPHFVYRDPAEVFRLFLATPYVAHGSDQRADWVANLLMLIPFGFLVAGTVWPSRPAFRLPAAIGTVLICVATILTIKYLQLFFPPRTVTLNYIVAQTLGSVIGCACFAASHRRFSLAGRRGDPVAALVLFLRLYLVALLIFLLMPLDFALSAADLQTQIERFPDTLLALPGGDRPLAMRAILIAAAGAAFIPVGMLLTFVKAGVYRVRRGILSVACIGLAITTGVFAFSTLVISAAPMMVSIVYRSCGIVLGAVWIRWLSRQDPDALRGRLRRLVPWAIVPYLVVLLLVNRLLSADWLSVQDAIAQANPLGLLPLFDYYIVTKAMAAKNIVGHAVL